MQLVIDVRGTKRRNVEILTEYWRGGEKGLPISESWTVEPHNSNETQKYVRSQSGTGIAKAGACETSSD